MAARASGAAQRRTLRRMRAAWRHKQQVDRNGPGVSTSPLSRQDDQAQHEAPRRQKNADVEYFQPSSEE